ncbi:MAG: NADH-quinone oxidoreductase subunit NuoK [Deltaproteobacteria bacterium]|nr:NADH-quinone oxidoreductase subunit NuoK [Deltaproteobacteria bacterium]
MTAIGLNHYLVLSAILFCIGALGVLVRRNLLVMLMSVEIMLSAANLALVASSRFGGSLDGQVLVLFSFVIAACEVAVGLGIVVAAFRHRPTVEVTEWRQLQG